MKRGGLADESGGSMILTIVLIVVVIGGIFAFSGVFKGLNAVNVPLTSIVAACDAAADLEQGKAEYCTLSTDDFTELNARKQYVDCAYLAEKGLLENPTPVFQCPPVASGEREKSFCVSLVAQRDAEKDIFVNGRPCFTDGGSDSYTSQTFKAVTEAQPKA
jgi:hypothetical protein